MEAEAWENIGCVCMCVCVPVNPIDEAGWAI